MIEFRVPRAYFITVFYVISFNNSKNVCFFMVSDLTLTLQMLSDSRRIPAVINSLLPIDKAGGSYFSLIAESLK